MRHLTRCFLLACLGLGLGVLSLGPASAQRRPGVNAPEFSPSYLGSVDISVGTGAWTEFTSDDFANAASPTGAALPAGQRLAWITITNNHATQDLRLLTVGSATAPLSAGVLIEAGATRGFGPYYLIDGPVTAISLQGTGPATTAHVTTWWMGS